MTLNLTQLTASNLGRTISHAVLAFVGALVPQLVWTDQATLKASVIAAFPAALAVFYRSLFPNPPTPGTVPAFVGDGSDAWPGGGAGYDGDTYADVQPTPTPVTPLPSDPLPLSAPDAPTG